MEILIGYLLIVLKDPNKSKVTEEVLELLQGCFSKDEDIRLENYNKLTNTENKEKLINFMMEYVSLK